MKGYPLLDWANQDDELEREAREFAPQPPPTMAERWLLWAADRRGRGFKVGDLAHATLELLERFPRWPREVGQQERRRHIAPKLLKAIDGWDGASSLVILGPTDAGKTVGLYETTVAHVVRSVLARTPWHRPLFCKALEVSQAWRQQQLGHQEPKIVERCRDEGLLLLDDLGQEPNDPQAVLWSIADARYDARLPTIVTSGLKQDMFLQRYGDAHLRRYIDAGGKGSGCVVDLWTAKAPT